MVTIAVVIISVIILIIWLMTSSDDAKGVDRNKMITLGGNVINDKITSDQYIEYIQTTMTTDIHGNNGNTG